ncbi:MAG: host attachment protein [Ectothiorhodospiraceae bacterium]|nr:host attachment protein [Ectothiorhodospiraceae bacterium]MCH8503332.1 host attachment protein [Ectothiorhodospiraceae bacterium]
MDTIWVVVAEQSRARIFSMNGRWGALEEVDNLVHPKGRLHDQDINADRPGRSFDTVGEGRHGMSKRHSPKEMEAIRFATDVSRRVAQAHHEGAFKELVLVAPPRFLALLRERLPEAVTRCVILSEDKNLSRADPTAIRAHIGNAFSS